MPFAVELLQGHKRLEDCPPLKDAKFAKDVQALHELLGKPEGVAENGIVLNQDLCDGCGICVIACPVNPRYSQECLSGKAPDAPVPADVIYVLEDGKSKIQSIEQCRRYFPPKTNCRVCEMYCPRYAIEIKV
jgi:4Fe-4S ferredoxin